MVTLRTLAGDGDELAVLAGHERGELDAARR